jgi:hypothetical protein
MVRNVTDPYLYTGSYEVPAPATSADRAHTLARRLGLPRSLFEDMSPEALDVMEGTSARIEENEEMWGDLARSVARMLTAAGFVQHDPLHRPGGFHLSLWEDGVVMAWSTTEYPEDSVSPFEHAVMSVMHPALMRILQDSGYTASIIPEEEDNAGYIRITAWQEPNEA